MICRLSIVPFLVAVLSAGIAGAQVVSECEDHSWIASPSNIAEPWADNARAFASGAIRIAHLDTGGEPACCASHILVLSPSGSGEFDPVYRQCRLISARDGTGFFWADVSAAQASYDPALGLLVRVPVQVWHQGVEMGQAARSATVRVRINQASGTVTLE